MKSKETEQTQFVTGSESRGRGVSIGHDGDGERSGFSDFSLRATERQASAQPVRRVLIPLVSSIHHCQTSRLSAPARRGFTH